MIVLGGGAWGQGGGKKGSNITTEVTTRVRQGGEEKKKGKTTHRQHRVKECRGTYQSRGISVKEASSGVRSQRRPETSGVGKAGSTAGGRI